MKARALLIAACLGLGGCGGVVAAPRPSTTARSTTGRGDAGGTRNASSGPGRSSPAGLGSDPSGHSGHSGHSDPSGLGSGPSSPGPISETAGPSPVAGEVVIAFATAYINWSARTVSADMRALAAQSIGQARSAMELAAGETGHDYELQRGGIANSGQVEAVAPLNGQDEQWAVVTRELTTATSSTAYEGLAPAWHVTVATVTELSSGKWVVSGWQPES
jgi:hypothetical protein